MPDPSLVQSIYVDFRTDRLVESLSSVTKIPNQVNTYMLNDSLAAFTWRLSALHGGWSGQLSFGDNDTTKWRDLVLSLDGVTAEMRLRVINAGLAQTTDWVPVFVDASSLSVHAENLRGVISFLDARSQMTRTTRRRAWLNQTPQDVIALLAQEYGVQAVVGELGNQADNYWQCGISDWDFLRGDIHPDLYAGSRGDVYLWLDGTKLRVGAFDFGAQPVRSFGIGTNGDSRVSSFRVLSRPARSLRRGGGRARSSALFPSTKQFTVHEVDQGTRSQTPALASRLPFASDDFVHHIASFETDDNALTGKALRHWARQAQSSFLAVLDISPDLLIKPGDIVMLSASKPGMDSPFGGKYVVVEVAHELNPSKTQLTLLRREAAYGSEAADGSVAEGAPSDDSYPTTGTLKPRIRRSVEPL